MAITVSLTRLEISPHRWVRSICPFRSIASSTGVAHLRPVTKSRGAALTTAIAITSRRRRNGSSGRRRYRGDYTSVLSKPRVLCIQTSNMNTSGGDYCAGTFRFSAPLGAEVAVLRVVVVLK
eukprot:7673091-Pyramimonas_sp.AAC.1